MTVGIIDYGISNVSSVVAAVMRAGQEPVVSADPDVLNRTEQLILPGVGAFGDGMKNLIGRGLKEPLDRMVGEERMPILGICLGAQLMCRDSEESPGTEGFGWLPASVRRLRPDDSSLRVPHVGWDEFDPIASAPLFDGVPGDTLFYYVHSYAIYSEDTSIVSATCDYGGVFAAALRMKNVFATQFHPEKSQLHGLRVIENFVTTCPAADAA